MAGSSVPSNAGIRPSPKCPWWCSPRSTILHKRPSRTGPRPLSREKGRGPVLDGLLCSIVERGEHHHGHFGEGLIPALLGTELPAIHHRHHEVEQNQSWQAFGVTHEFKRLAAISGALHFVPQPREHFGKCFALAELILDDENLRLHKSTGTGTTTKCEFSGRTGL